MEYNTQQKRMPLPEYGRSIQNMVNYALTLESKEERQRCASTIIDVMGNMFPHLRDVPDFKHKLWDHLSIMANFSLDIDYPYEVVKKDSLNTFPDRIPYPQNRIRFRYYGKTIEKLVDKAIEFEEGDEKNQLVALIANHMRKDFLAWNRDSVDDDIINSDLRELSRGRLSLTEDVLALMNMNTRQVQQHPVRHKNTRNNPRRNHKH